MSYSIAKKNPSHVVLRQQEALLVGLVQGHLAEVDVAISTKRHRLEASQPSHAASVVIQQWLLRRLVVVIERGVGATGPIQQGLGRRREVVHLAILLQPRIAREQGTPPDLPSEEVSQYREAWRLGRFDDQSRG
jgi:hypothetical protein